MISLDNKVIATTEGMYFSIYTIVKEGQDIEELIYKAEHQFTNFPEYNRKYYCTTFGEYLKKEKEFYALSCHSTTEEDYYDMLEVLPPIYIRDYEIPNYKVLNAFMVSEPLSGGYHNAYLKYKNNKNEIKFASKIVYAGDRSTYWTKEDLDKIEKGEKYDSRIKNY